MKKSKKVLFVATVAGHINAFHIPYLKMFKEKGYEVHVATKRANEVKFADQKYEICFERFPLKKNNIIAYKQLKEIINKNQYDIIHCHTPVGGVLTRLAAKKTRKSYNTKVIYTAHGFHFYKGAPISNWLIYYPIEKWLSKYTDTLITINEEDYEFAKKNLKVKNIRRVHGVGMNTSRLNKKISEIEEAKIKIKNSIQKNDIVISYIAELNNNKNQQLLINVVEKFKKQGKNIILLLIGDGKNKEIYQDMINNKALNKNIYLLGRRSDIQELLTITDIYVASSIREGLPVNVMEAMYMSLPIVATNNRGHRELVENKKNGYILENNIEQFYDKIKELIDNKEKRKKYGNYSKKIVYKYTIENVINEMNIIYNNK